MAFIEDVIGLFVIIGITMFAFLSMTDTPPSSSPYSNERINRLDLSNELLKLSLQKKEKHYLKASRQEDRKHVEHNICCLITEFVIITVIVSLIGSCLPFIKTNIRITLIAFLVISLVGGSSIDYAFYKFILRR